MSKADLIRKHVIVTYLKPNKRRGKSEITLRSGDIHKELNLKNNIANVCQTMGGRKLESDASVKLIKREPASDGANVYFTYRLDHTGVSKKTVCLAGTYSFLIKTKVGSFFPNGELPIQRDEWSGLEVNIPELKGEHKHFADILENEFDALLWLHENPRSGSSGQGLMAALRLVPIGRNSKAKIVEAEHFDPVIGSDTIFGKANVESDLIEQINRYRQDRMWPLDEEAVDVLQLALFNQKENFSESERDPSLIENLTFEPVQYGLRKTQIRAQQSLFRKRLMSTYGRVCQLSNTSQIEVLEAAHIVPYKYGLPDRNSIGNGLLLRSDIHKLFDQFLISINPETGVFVVSKELGEDYLFIEGMALPPLVRHTSAAWHYEQFKERNEI